MSILKAIDCFSTKAASLFASRDTNAVTNTIATPVTNALPREWSQKRHSDPVSALFWYDGLARVPADTDRLVRLVSRMSLSTRKPQPWSDIRLENDNTNQVTGPGATVACHDHTYLDAFKIESMNSSARSNQTTSASATSGNLGTRKMNNIPGNTTFSTNSNNIRANASSTYETYNKRFDSNTPEYLFMSDMASSLDSSIDTNTDHSHSPDRHGDHIASGNADKGTRNAHPFKISAGFFLTYLLMEEPDTMDGVTTENGENDGFSDSFNARAENFVDNLLDSVNYSFDSDDMVADAADESDSCAPATTQFSDKFVAMLAGMEETMRNMVYVGRNDAIDFQSRGPQTITTTSNLKVDEDGVPILTPGSVVYCWPDYQNHPAMYANTWMMPDRLGFGRRIPDLSVEDL